MSITKKDIQVGDVLLVRVLVTNRLLATGTNIIRVVPHPLPPADATQESDFIIPMECIGAIHITKDELAIGDWFRASGNGNVTYEVVGFHGPLGVVLGENLRASTGAPTAFGLDGVYKVPKLAAKALPDLSKA